MPLTIAVSGKHGAGKSTVAEALAEKFKLRYISAGEIFRQLAKERGMSLSDFSLLAENDPSIDHEIDDRTRLEATKGDVVIDAYIAGWIAQDYADVKIYLRAPLEIRVQRIAQRDKRSYDEIFEETKVREESQQRRFQEFYGIDVTDMRLFDIILNTGTWSAESVIEICIAAIKTYLHRSKKK